MLRHDHIAINTKPEAATDTLKRVFKDMFTCVCQEQSATPIAIENDEVSLSRFMKSLQARRHVSEFKFLELRPALIIANAECLFSLKSD